MNKSRMFTGLFFIGAAILLTLNGLDLLGSFSLWTILFGFGSFILLVNSILTKNATGTIFSIAFLYIAFDQPLNIDYLSTWTTLWIATFLSLGVHFLSKPNRKNHIQFNDEEYKSGNNLYISSSFKETTKYVNSDHFQGANISASFGSAHVYLDKANIYDSASIHVDASFGSIHLYVPNSWQIISSISTNFGDYKEVGISHTSNDSSKLYLAGDVTFGEITLHYI